MAHLELAESHVAPERRARSDRRRRSALRVDWRYASNGRRRGVRRGDDTRAPTILDWYPTDLLIASIGVLVLSVTDAALTLFLISSGHAAEANPVMAVILQGGDRFFVAVKMLVTCVGVTGLVAFSSLVIARRIPIRRVLFWLLGAYVVLVGYELYIVLELVPNV